MCQLNCNGFHSMSPINPIFYLDDSIIALGETWRVAALSGPVVAQSVVRVLDLAWYT